MNNEVRFLSLCGLLGYGYPEDSLTRGLRTRPHFIGVDAGSTDPGPYYLGAGRNFVTPRQVERDLEPALSAARAHGIPLIIGSAGGSGARPHVDDTVELVHRLAQRHGLKFRLAVIYADLAQDLVLDRLDAGAVHPCGPVGELTSQQVASAVRIVGQMGTDPIIRALESGADVIVAGRCCDTAIFAAFPMLHGFDPGLALHCAKIAECGTLCARPAGANDVLVAALRETEFVVRPANPQRQCTPPSVMAHSLYEQPDPTCFYEPEGKVDLSASVFESVDDRAVRVSGTRLEVAEQPTVKLEGVRLAGYRAFTIASIRDPLIIRNLGEIEHRVREAVHTTLGCGEGESFHLAFRRFGACGPEGQSSVTAGMSPEVGLIIEVVAPSQEEANTILSLARSTALHQSFPGRKTTAGNLAFPFSPSDFSGGPVYEFCVYHLMETREDDDLFPVTFLDV